MNQKEAVVKEVISALPNFTKYSDVAVNLLSSSQLETIKVNVGKAILAGTVEYSKDKTKTSEVMSYARSMVMNHLKKAKELNGNVAYQTSGSGKKTTTSKTNTTTTNITGIKMHLLTDELKEHLSVCGLV